MNKTSLIDTRTREVVAAAEIHKTMVAGFPDTVYREALAFEFSWRGTPFRKDVPLLISCKSAILSTLKAQFVCFDEVLVEPDSPDTPDVSAATRMMNNLKATGLETGNLLYSGRESLGYRCLSLRSESIPDHFTYGEV